MVACMYRRVEIGMLSKMIENLSKLYTKDDENMGKNYRKNYKNQIEIGQI
jgi:hypothetical protein